MDTELPNLAETVVATTRLLESVARLDDHQVREPSVLPGWTRGHVITHLARNADALAGVLRAAEAGVVGAMYPSQEQRDAEVESGAGRSARELLDDLVAACGRWHRAVDELHVANLDNPMSRLPGGPTQPVRRVGMMRRSEVEVHHADLATGYSAADWPTDFVAAMMKRRHQELQEAGVAVRWRATDTGESWDAGGGPEVTGTAADIVWWLLGRGTGEALACSEGRLPELGRWA